jgi:hypothetical protein
MTTTNANPSTNTSRSRSKPKKFPHLNQPQEPDAENMIRSIQCGTGTPACAPSVRTTHLNTVQGSNIFLVSWNLNLHQEHAV